MSSVAGFSILSEKLPLNLLRVTKCFVKNLYLYLNKSKNTDESHFYSRKCPLNGETFVKYIFVSYIIVFTIPFQISEFIIAIFLIFKSFFWIPEQSKK